MYVVQETKAQNERWAREHNEIGKKNHGVKNDNTLSGAKKIESLILYIINII
jgi:hypothetical protein